MEVIGDPAGAGVSVNGHEVGKLPLPDAVRVSAGEVDVEVRRPGYLGAQRNVTIVGGQYQRVVIHLAKESLPAAEPAPGPGPEVPRLGPAGGAPPAADEEPSRLRVDLKWGAAGLAGAGLITGVVFTILHSSNVSSFQSHGCAISGGKGVWATTGVYNADCDSRLGTSQTYQDVMIAGYVAAGAFAATWLILQLTDHSGAARDATSQAARRPLCGPASSGVGLACAIRFQ